MYQSVEKCLTRLLDENHAGLLREGGLGLEKESLRVSANGGIALTQHPASLGSALTHPHITTDYSEALVELVTPPTSGVAEALNYLQDLQKFVYSNLENELLWATSMPCVLAGGENIPLARYGDSNAGQMKTIYRRGLGYRYGRAMQVIAGVHYNFSFSPSLWPLFMQITEGRGSLREFTDGRYLGVTRNLQRYGWLIPYLFGASPAVCKSFVGGKPTRLKSFDETTYYQPYATSLRMGDIGYTNSKELGVGIKANYNSLDAYVASLTRAIETPSPVWQVIGMEEDGRYKQLNTNILQIENEYYSTVRPKQILEGMEKPTLALKRRGVRYIELRSLDVNAMHPLGVSEEQLQFLEAFMIFCLLQDSPPIDIRERREIDQNIGAVAHRGRDPQLRLLRHAREIPLKQWGEEICQAMSGICALLDADDPEQPYSKVLAGQIEIVGNPELTPSARMLEEMHDRGEGFFSHAQRMSLQHKRYFDDLELSTSCRERLEKEARDSIQRQKEIEATDDQTLEQFLADYFAQ